MRSKESDQTTIAKFDAILMMFAEGVHRLLLCGEIPGIYRGECLCDIEHPAGHSKGQEACRVRSSLGQFEMQLLWRRQNSGLALRSKVADLRIEDSQNLANANYSDLPLLWQSAVKDARAGKRNKCTGYPQLFMGCNGELQNSASPIT
jgi:hypothetical protein